MTTSTLVLLAVVSIAGAVAWRAFSRRHGAGGEGDFERRLDMLRAGQVPAGSAGARMPIGPATEAPRQAGAIVGSPATGPEGTAPGPSRHTAVVLPFVPRRMVDPVFGPLQWADDDEWESGDDNTSSVPGYVNIEAGLEGPSDRQRACYASFRDRHAEIEAQAIALVRQHLEADEQPVPVALRVSSLWIEAVGPDRPFANAALYVPLDDAENELVVVTSPDHWRTLIYEG